MMKEYKYKDATVYIRGEISQKRLEDATIRFIKKVDKYRRNNTKEEIQTGNEDTTRDIVKK